MYKTLLDGLESDHGKCKWTVGKWKRVRSVSLCNKGFHCSELILDAMKYVSPGVIAEVEVRGKSDIQEDKQAWSEMRLIKTWDWTKEDSVALAIYSSELVIKNFEKEYPDDKRPREAIKAAKKWLKNPTEENESAAWSARSAWSAAWSAAKSAARSAWSADWAARSAWLAARSAAQSAGSADWAARSAESADWATGSAWSAAWSAARSAESADWATGSAESATKDRKFTQTKLKIEKFILKRLEKKL